jgi:hypothetical protein
MFIVVKIKYVNSGRISDICDKVNFSTNYTQFITSDIHFITQHTTFYKILTNIIIFDTFGRMVPQRDLRISLKVYMYYIFSIFYL